MLATFNANLAYSCRQLLGLFVHVFHTSFFYLINYSTRTLDNDVFTQNGASPFAHLSIFASFGNFQKSSHAAIWLLNWIQTQFWMNETFCTIVILIYLTFDVIVHLKCTLALMAFRFLSALYNWFTFKATWMKLHILIINLILVFTLNGFHLLLLLSNCAWQSNWFQYPAKSNLEIVIFLEIIEMFIPTVRINIL